MLKWLPKCLWIDCSNDLYNKFPLHFKLSAPVSLFKLSLFWKFVPAKLDFCQLVKVSFAKVFSFSKYAFLFIYNLSEVNKKILVVHFIKCCVLGLKDVPKCSYDNGRGTKKFSLLYFSEYLENADFQLFFWIM